MQIVGRNSSHFTRLPRIFAQELGVPLELVPIYDMRALGPEVYAGNPALKLPILRTEQGVVFGALNICRVIAERATRPARIVWPEDLRDELSRNAQEMVWHAMTAQVHIIMGTGIGKLPAENIYFAKMRAGFEGALRWLDANLEAALRALPAPRDLSVFEVSLFCLIEHLAFRVTVPVEPYTALTRFATDFAAAKPSLRQTAYRFDTPPAQP
ncbi:MAG TPA: glutathione S-transferase family protein [Steroidobacteraceae bacterium]|jgi:glutathione S-transferase|nr:glutathione S-transferase family protein [Steroidobacteraceae bacterium]